MLINAISVVAAVVILIFSLFAAYNVNTDSGSVQVQTVTITSSRGQVSSLLYKPHSASNVNPAAAVVLAHGISSSKQFLSGIALELARNGIVALPIDLFGHGDSEGELADGTDDATFGALACVQFLESQQYVNSSLIGLIGHSLGAGAARATAVIHGNIRATVFIGGGFGSTVAGPEYGMLNSTFPKNLLVAIGKQDVLFDLPSLQKEVLPSVFGTTARVETDVLYGDFFTQTARELVTPDTTHLFEPLDPIVVSKTVEWLMVALKPDGVELQSTKDLVFLHRDVAVLVSLLAVITLVVSAPALALKLSRPKAEELRKPWEVRTSFLQDWKILLIWGASSLILFFPMVFVGFALSIPPLLFGASFAWWLLATGLVGLSAVGLQSRSSKLKLGVKSAIMQAFDLRGTAVAIAAFILLYLLAFIFESFLCISLGVITPFFIPVTQARRAVAFLMFVPFFLVYFIAEGLILHEFRRSPPTEIGWRNTFLDLVKVEVLKVGPFLAILFLQYFPLFVFGYLLFSGLAGFLMEFLWIQPVLFTISTACSWMLYRNVRRVGACAIFNALMFAWIAAAIFPF